MSKYRLMKIWENSKIWNSLRELPYGRFFRKAGYVLLQILIGLIPVIILLYTPSMINGYLSLKPSALKYEPQNEDEAAVLKMTKESDKLAKKLDNLTPKGSYILINTTTNTFRLYNKRELVREGNCSTGSNVKLVKEDDREWMFKTPKGVRRVLYKTKDPVWKKPDWAFIEEGLPVPSMNHDSRYEYGVLGDYSLSLGDGYLIHGTLYQRFLGMPVTHGCVRLGDEDLEVVFKTLTSGSKVFIF
jgi:L,D-transpeptidase YbiS